MFTKKVVRREIDNYKEQISDFVMKLYVILERPEFHDFIVWANEGTEIQIKSPKKFEEKVLPNYFRHRHIASFIRQLNMYNFNKVNKISKQRSHMFFKNPLFVRDQFEEMTQIKRRCKKPNKGEKMAKLEQFSDPAEADEQFDMGVASKDKKSEDCARQLFKEESYMKFMEISVHLLKIIKKNPEMEKQLGPILKICQGMQNYESQCQIFYPLNTLNDMAQENNKNIFNGTFREIKNELNMFNSIVLPSFCSFANLDNNLA